MPVVPKKHAPCFGQTEESIDSWLRANAKAGVHVVVRHTQHHALRYEQTVITGMGKGRVYTDLGSFYYSGKNCYHPKGQTRLVLATVETLAACDAFSCEEPAYMYDMSV